MRPGFSIGLVTTCSVGVDLETRVTLFQLICVCSGGMPWAAATPAMERLIAKKVSAVLRAYFSFIRNHLEKTNCDIIPHLE